MSSHSVNPVNSSFPIYPSLTASPFSTLPRPPALPWIAGLLAGLLTCCLLPLIPALMLPRQPEGPITSYYSSALNSSVAPDYPYRKVTLLTRALRAMCVAHASLHGPLAHHTSRPALHAVPAQGQCVCWSLCPGVCRSPFRASCLHLLSLPRPSPAIWPQAPFPSVTLSSRSALSTSNLLGHSIELLFVCVPESPSLGKHLLEGKVSVCLFTAISSGAKPGLLDLVKRGSINSYETRE